MQDEDAAIQRKGSSKELGLVEWQDCLNQLPCGSSYASFKPDKILLFVKINLVVFPRSLSKLTLKARLSVRVALKVSSGGKGFVYLLNLLGTERHGSERDSSFVSLCVPLSTTAHKGTRSRKKIGV